MHALSYVALWQNPGTPAEYDPSTARTAIIVMITLSLLIFIFGNKRRK